MPSICLSRRDTALKQSHLAVGHPSVPSMYDTRLAPMQAIKCVTLPELAETPEGLGSPTLTPLAPRVPRALHHTYIHGSATLEGSLEIPTPSDSKSGQVYECVYCHALIKVKCLISICSIKK